MDAPPSDPLVGRQFVHYRITERLGAGGMGVVYKALDQKLGRPVALKFLPPHLAGGVERLRLMQEARAASALDHPNIGTIHGVEEAPEGQLFIVMAYYQGATLSERLSTGPLESTEVIEVGLQVASALAEAHRKDILHRDIKPGNIMTTTQGVTKLLDFGLAKYGETESLTLTGTTLGTPAYMAPEQAMGEPASVRSDIWAFGVVLYEMLSGRRPFRGDNAPSILRSIVHDAPTVLTGIPDSLQTIVYRCLAKDPALRYQKAEDLIAELRPLAWRSDAFSNSGRLREQALQAATTGAANLQPLNKRRSRLKLIAAIALVFTLLIAAAVWTRMPLSPGGSLIPKEKHVVVLPFTNIGGDTANTAILDGIFETLTSQLSSLERLQSSLWVVPANEVRRRNIDDAGAAQRTFGANLVVTGSLQRDSNGARLTLNLVDTHSLRQLGSAVIDDRLADYSTLQDRAVAELAKLLEVEVNPGGLARAPGESATPAAYESYLKGLSYLQRYDKPGNLDSAIEFFDSAVKADPRFALAYARLADAERTQYRMNHDPRFLTRALVDAKRAVALNDQLAPSRVILAEVHDEGGNPDLAIQEYQRALALDPRNADAHQHIASTYESQGRNDDAEKSLKKAIALRPDYWDGYNSLGVFYYRRGKYPDAAAQFRKVIDLTPDNAGAYTNLGVMLKSLNDEQGARRAYEKSISIAPSYAAYSNLAGILYNQADYARAAGVYEQALKLNDRDYRPWGGLASAAEAAGMHDKARQALERAVAIAEPAAAQKPNDPTLQSYLASYFAKLGVRDKAVSRIETALVLAPRDQLVLYMAAITYESLGDRPAALKWLKAALDQGYSAASVKQDPDLRAMHNDRTFQALTK